MKRKLFWGIISLVIIGIIGFGAYHLYIKSPTTFATQLILMCIDDTEPSLELHQLHEDGALDKNAILGASGIDLLTALYQESCIIIVTASVVSYLMRYLHEVSSNPFKLNPELFIKPENWIKKKVTEYLYILIPKKYITTRTNHSSLESYTNSIYTAEELTLGISFVSKEDINDIDFMSPAYHKKNSDYPKKIEPDIVGSSKIDIAVPWVSSHVIEQLPSIFIACSNYSNQKYIPNSVILLFGHGSKYISLDDRIALMKNLKISQNFGPKIDDEIKKLEQRKQNGEKVYSAGTIGGLRRNDFGRLIEFLTSTIRTPLLFARTCFSSEINLEAALQMITPENSIVSINPSFPLLSGAISSAIVLAGYKVSVDEDRRLLTFPLYNDFFATFNTYAATDDERIFNALQFIYFFYKKYKSYNNIPIIKYPNQPWRALEITKVVITLNEKMQPSHNVLDISPFFAQKKVAQLTKSCNPPPIEEFLSYNFAYPNILLLKEATIPFELTISGKSPIDLPAFISQIPGDAVHHLTKINAATYNLTRVFESFFPIEKLEDNKTFIIDELIAKNDLTILSYDLGKALSVYHVVLKNTFDPYKKTSHKSVYFETPDGKKWSAENISMSNPVGFAIKLEKKNDVKVILKEHNHEPKK